MVLLSGFACTPLVFKPPFFYIVELILRGAGGSSGIYRNLHTTLQLPMMSISIKPKLARSPARSPTCDPKPCRIVSHDPLIVW